MGACGPERPWTVLPESEVRALRQPCSRDFPEGLTGYWAPGKADLVDVERQIDALVARELAAQYGDADDEQDRLRYRRQYVGFERAGQRVIYVNAVAAGSHSWRRHTVNICDGSVISFGAVYDPTRHRFDWFMFNGPYNGRKRPGPR